MVDTLNLSHCLPLVTILMVAAPSHHHPVPFGKEVPPSYVQTDTAFSERHPGRQERQEPWYGDRDRPDVEEKAALSAEALDTMRKINPLTIADQVSQMFQNKANNAKSSYGKVKSKQYRGLISEGDGDGNVARLNNVPAPQVEEAARRPQPDYIKEDPPTIVHKPRTNDFGYSVIVVAGDPVEVKNKGSVQVMGPGNPNRLVYSEKEREPPVYEKNREWRVPKPFNAFPNFPVYDEDINFIPDPLNGILDENYCGNQGATHNRQLGNVRAKPISFVAQETQVRGGDGLQMADLYGRLSGIVDSVVTLNAPAFEAY